MLYIENMMVSIVIDTPSWWRSQFNLEVNESEIICAADLINEIRDVSYTREFTSK